MSRPNKPISMQNRHLSKDEINTREQLEGILTGTKDIVYKAPVKLNMEQQKIYKNLVELLKPLDILSDLDVELVTLASDSIYQMDEARKNIEELGQVIVITDNEGNIVKVSKNPSIEIYKTFENIYNRCCSQLALSPSARAKLSAEITNAIRLQKQEEEDQPKELSKEELELQWLMS